VSHYYSIRGVQQSCPHASKCRATRSRPILSAQSIRFSVVFFVCPVHSLLTSPPYVCLALTAAIVILLSTPTVECWKCKAQPLDLSLHSQTSCHSTLSNLLNYERVCILYCIHKNQRASRSQIFQHTSKIQRRSVHVNHVSSVRPAYIVVIKRTIKILVLLSWFNGTTHTETQQNLTDKMRR
jgi:hypothetical protein